MDVKKTEEGNGIGRIIKLHGSIDWKLSGDNILTGIASPSEKIEEHGILYPGYKNNPVNRIFTRMHEHLRLVCNNASIAIFIGFSFRDKHINSILREIPNKTRKIVINKGEQSTGIPFESEYKNNGFTQHTLNSIFRDS